MEEKKFSSLTFGEQVDAVLSGADTSSSHLEVLKNTPPLLRMVGLPNLPVLMTAKHLRSITQSEGVDRMNYHGLGTEIAKQLPELLSDPVMIMDSLTREDSVVVITKTIDKQDRPVIGAIKVNGRGNNLEGIEISANILTSAYGRNNFQAFLNNSFGADKILYCDERKSQELFKTLGIQFPDNLKTLSFNTIIRKSKSFVNSQELKNLRKEEEKMDIPTTKVITDARERARKLAAETGEPYVTIQMSENPALSEGEVLSLSEADKKLAALDRVHYGGNYDKVSLAIDYIKNGKADSYEDCRFDIGDEECGLVEHIKEYWEFYLENKNWRKRMESQHMPDYVEAAYDEYKRMANDVAPYFKHHLELSAMAAKAQASDLSAEEIAEVQSFVRKSRLEANGIELDAAAYEGKHEEKSDVIDRIAPAAEPTPSGPLNYRDKVNKIREDMAQTILSYIENNPADWQRGWSNLSGAPVNGKTGTAYRGINSLYLAFVGMSKGYTDPRWVTFNQAKDLGASIKKGEKSLPVLFFEFYDRKTKKAYDERTTRDMTDEERSLYEKENVYAVMKYSSVFNAAQCVNFPERDIESLKMSEEERANQNAIIEMIIANSAAPVNYDGGNRAYYSPSTDDIHLPAIEAFNSMQDYYATALHEIAHSTGHESRLSRDLTGEKGSASYAVEELRAELACVFMQTEHGIQIDGKHVENHAAYVKSWLEAVKSDPQTFYNAVRDAEKIADYVSEHYLQSVQVDELELEAENEAQDSAEQQARSDKDDLAVEEHIRQWYVSAFPNDELGAEIKEEVTFEELSTAIENGEDIYELLGVADSIVRERAFARLADLQGKTYDEVYNTYSNNLSLGTSASEQEEHKEKVNQQRNEKRTDKTLLHNSTDGRTVGAELADKPYWIKINLADSAIGKTYGSNTLVKMPEGEYSYFALYVPNKFLKQVDGKWQLTVGSSFTYKLNNDSKQVVLTGQELRDSFAGMQIGKKYTRVAPSRAYAKVLDNLVKNVPDELKNIPTWCCYRTKWDNEKGKKSKFIISPVDGKWASSKEPQRWVTFDAAIKYARENGCEGVSLLLDRKHGVTCIDLDKCIINAQTGEMKGRATKLVQELNGTYMERSTSGNGIHIFVKEDVLKNGTYRNTADTVVDDPRGDLEVFDDKRIISMTGDMISKTNELTRAGSAATVYLRSELGLRGKAAAPSNTTPRVTSGQPQSDNEIIKRIRASKSAAQFSALYDSRVGVTGDKSKDDYKLANMLLYFNEGDTEQAFRIMRTAQIYRPEKPDSYYEHTISKANDDLKGNYAKRPNPFAARNAAGNKRGGAGKPTGNGSGSQA